MTSFAEVMAAAGPPRLSGLRYRQALVALNKPTVRDEAFQAPIGPRAWSWAQGCGPEREMERRALRAIAVQPDYRTGRVTLFHAQLLASGSRRGLLSYDALAPSAVASATCVFSGAAVEGERAAASAIDLLEDHIGPVVGMARFYLQPLWGDWYACRAEWPDGLCRPDGNPSLSGLSRWKIATAAGLWARRVRRAPQQQTDAARMLAVGSTEVRGWLVLLANRDPLASITRREAGVWGRLAWLADLSAEADRASTERARRHAQAHWHRRLQQGLDYEDPYEAIRQALNIAA